MPFNGPNYEIPAGTLKPAVVGTPVSAADWNAFITDLQTALTDTLRATTQAFVGQVFFDDTAPAGAPAIAFTLDTDTGIFQKGANELGFATGGLERVLVTDTLVTVTDDLTITGDLTVTGNINGTLPSVATATSAEIATFSHTGDLLATDVTDGETGPLTCTGRPVVVALQSSGAAALRYCRITQAGTLLLYRKVDAGAYSLIASSVLGGVATDEYISFPPYLDLPGAGTITYKLAVQLLDAGSTCYIYHQYLVAYQL
jgi:hypothetical protein